LPYGPGGDNRNNSPYMERSNDGWGSARERHMDYSKRFDRYDKYQGRNHHSQNYHRDHRDRGGSGGDRDRRPDKRRYPPTGYGGAGGHYLPPNYYMGNGAPPGALPPHSYRDGRYPMPPEWSSPSGIPVSPLMSGPQTSLSSGPGNYSQEYRRTATSSNEYDRRQPSTHSNS